MIIYGNPIGITVGDSSSLSEGVISLNSPLPGLYFLFSDGNYSSSIDSGSVGIIQATVVTASSEGAAGALTFTLSDPLDPKSSGSNIIRFENNRGEPRVGIGFPLDEPILTAFDIKSKQNTNEGTQIFLRSTRPTRGADPNDAAGSIFFLVESGSYNTGSKSRFIQSGSIASITTTVTSVSAEGAQGFLKFNLSRTNSEATRALWTMGYGADPRMGGNFGSITTGSLNIVRPTYVDDDLLTFTNPNGEYISLTYISSSIEDNSQTIVHSFATGSYNGVLYDYVLVYPTKGGRTGQIMVFWDGSSADIEITDVSTPALMNGGIPRFEGSIENIPPDSIFKLSVTDGNGYVFKAFVRKI
jgi:hypothetical protein